MAARCCWTKSSDMPLETQGKIVRALQDSTFERLGGSARVKVDVRVLSTTNKDLQAEIATGRFREDLYYRLAVVPLKVPALKDRREDVPALAQHFIVRSAESSGMPAARIVGRHAGGAAGVRLAGQRAPVAQSDGLAADHGAWRRGRRDPRRHAAAGDRRERAGAAEHRSDARTSWALPLREARDLFETQYLQAQLLRFGGNISRTAQFVGMERSALHRKLKQLGVNSDEKVGG